MTTQRARGALEVILFADRKFVGSQEFTDPEITVGSDPGALLRLDDPQIDPTHALIHFTGRTCIIEDHGSRGGTFCRGARIDSHVVQPTDEIVIGRFTLRFVTHQATTAAGAPAAVIATAPPPAVAQTPPPAIAQTPPPAVAQTPPPAVAPAPTPVVPPVAEPKPAIAQTPAPSVTQEPAEPEGETEFEAELEAEAELEVEPDAETAAAGATEAAARHDDDDDEDDAPFVPSFSLLGSLRDHASLPQNVAGAAVQAVFARDDVIIDVTHLLPGDRIALTGVTSGACTFDPKGTVAIQGMTQVRRRGEPTFADAADGVALAFGDAALVHLGARDQVLLHFVPRVADLPRAGGRAKPDRQNFLTGVATLAAHALVFVVLSLTPSERIAAAVTNDPNAGRFAMIEMKDPLMETPKPKQAPKKEKPKPPKPPPPHLRPPPPLPPPPMPTLPPSLRSFVSTQRRDSGPINPKASAKTNQLLSALGGVGGPSASAGAAVTNLNAVTGAPSSGGGFKVSGAIGKVAGGGLVLAPAGSGTGSLGTRSGAEVTQGGKLGRVTGTASGNVRGVVKQTPARSVEVQGELDRGEIQKVVNAHLYEVQGCYERRLVKDSSLKGKIIFEWVISPTGSVGVVRVKFSEVRDTEVATCIQGSMRLWRFPQPKGGPVTVTYPFVFGTMSL